jgi:SAM-dependent methyltransferase
VFDDLVDLAGLEPGSRVVEIGPGTGQATLPLAERGLHVVGVELGPGLAAVAREHLVTHPNVEIVTAGFESWEPERADFDAVVAFTAFHWIDPEARYEKPARLLRAGGALAVVSTKHVAGADPFWIEVQEDYDAVTPSDDNRPPPQADAVPDLAGEIAGSGLFADVEVRRHLWDTSYDADRYLALLDTFSGHRALPDARRRELYDRIRRRIGDRRVRKTMLAILHVARRR